MGAEEAKSEAALGANEDPLESSRKDARVLLWFASRDGNKKVAETVLQDVVTAESNLREKDRTSDNEAKFWTAFRDLAAAVKPASVESILSTCQHPFGKHGPTGKMDLGSARVTKRWYTGAAVCVLITLLLLQTYWFVMTAFSENLEKHRDELDGIAGSLRLMSILADEMKQQQAETQALTKVKEEPNVANASSALPQAIQREQGLDGNPQVMDLIKNSIQNLLASNPLMSALVLNRDPQFQLTSMGYLDLENKKYRTQRLVAMLDNERSVLEKPWKVLWYLFMAAPPVQGDGQNAGDDRRSNTNAPPAAAADQENGQNAGDDNGSDTRTSSERFFSFLSDLKAQKKQITQNINNEELEQVLSQSKSIPQILSQYFLPMLYGLLGSLTYILRILATEINDVTFTRASAARYSLRWPLGMLAGVTIGLFFPPNYFAGLAAITPLGVAFLAGYGVELFFTGLDGLVRTFTRGDPERSKPEAT
jgi:hypothetical protein